MDPQSGSLRGAAAAAGAPMGRSEGVNKLPAGEEVEVAGGTLPEGEEVGEEPQLPKEPCFARPRPFGHTLKELVEQLGALATAASATLKSLGSRGVAGLRGGASSSGVRGGEETGPVDQAQREVPATEPVPERPVSEEAPVVKSPPVEESLDEEGAAGELGETEDKPQLPKEPCASKPERPNSGLKSLLMKALAAAAAAGVLLKDLGGRGVASMTRSRAGVQPIEAGAESSEQLATPPPPSPLDIQQPNNPLPRPEDVVGAGEMA